MSRVGSHVQGDEVGRDVDEAISRDWQTWSRTLGLIAVPHLQRLSEELPTLTSAMVCTGDGLNLAALGIDDDAVGRLAALSSSLFGVAGAHRGITDGAGDTGSTMISLAGEGSQSLVLRFEVALVGPLLLVISAQDVGLGVLLVEARRTADDLRAALAPTS